MKLKKNKVLVDVYMLVYNHEKYIEKAINSILMQKVNFNYRIVIADDCSSDKTPEILKKYEKKYPKKVKIILREKNLGMRENSRLLKEVLDAPYLALLEGDDYWSDEYKLQKQVDFLEKNKEYSCYASSVYMVDQNDQRNMELEKGFVNYCYDEDKIFTLEDAIRYVLPGQSATLMYRNFYPKLTQMQKDIFNSCRVNGDQKIALVNTLNGKIYCSKEKLATHRKVFDCGDSWSARTHGKNMAKFHYIAICDLEKLAYRGFGKKIDMSVAKNDRFKDAVMFFNRDKSLSNLKILLFIFVRNKGKLKMIKYFLKNEM